MSVLRSKMGLVVGGVVLGIVLGASVAMAASTIVTDTDNVHLRIVESQFENGFDSGWHRHPGPAIVQVEKGYFRLFQGTCEPKIVGPGQTFIEVPNVPVRAVAKGAIEWTTTLIYETGQAAATPASNPCS